MSAMFEHGYAVVVGVNENQIPRLALPAVANDVQAMYDVLVHPERCAYKPEHVKLIKDKEATKDNILDALEWLKAKAANDPKATAVLYYSGHGMEDKTKGKYYLVPYDIGGINRLRRDAIEAEELTEYTNEITAPRALFIFDCCHAAGLEVKDIDPDLVEEPEVEVSAFPIDLQVNDVPDYTAEPGAKDVSELEEGDGRAVLSSSEGAQKSYIPPGGKMSLFTQHLIEALTGHAPHPDDATVVWVTDVMSWVRHQVRKSAAEMGKEQTPVMRTTNVFPVAQLIGGQGVALGKGAIPPDPLQPLSEAAALLQARDISDSIVAGGDVDVQKGGIRTGDGATFEGPVAGGDQHINTEFVGGHKYTADSITAPTAMGEGARVSISGDPEYRHVKNVDYDKAFASLERAVAGKDPQLVTKVQALKMQVSRGDRADDEAVAALIQEITAADPTLVVKLLIIFADSDIADDTGPVTRYVIRGLG